MEEPIGTSNINPLKPDNRPIRDLIKAKINWQITNKFELDEIIIDTSDIEYDELLFTEICKEYEAVGWYCYFYRFVSMHIRVKMVLSKKKFERICYYIENREIKSKPFEYLVDFGCCISYETAKNIIESHKMFKYIKEDIIKEIKPEKNWLEKLFGI